MVNKGFAGSLRLFVRPAHRRVASILPLRVRRHYLHDLGVGRIGNFTEPETFNEKVNWRILHDRRKIIALACDKVRTKEAVRENTPENELRMARTLWVGHDINSFPEDLLREDWVLKPNNSSGQVFFGPATREDILRQVMRWSSSIQPQELGEWGYAQAESGYVLEERLPAASAPVDYKFFVFDGKPRVIQVDNDRFGDHSKSFFTTDWQFLDGADLRTKTTRDISPPGNLDRLLNVAAILGKGWDFIRVDLYSIENEVWFGELSPYPNGGVMRFKPKSFDRALGQYWRLPAVQ